MLRLQFDIDEGANETLTSYMELAGVQTKREYMNNALALLKWAIDERSLGRRIASVDPDNQLWREITMPILERVAERQPVAAEQ